MVRRLTRWARHWAATGARTRALFTPQVLTQIEQAITVAESQHAGEIRFAIETSLPLAAVWHRLDPRARALQVFSLLRVWDTEHNNGVLIYVLRADRAVEIVADRGISSAVDDAAWAGVCRQVEGLFRDERYAEGAVAAVSGVSRLLGEHFPPGANRINELPNQPVLL